MTQSVRVAGRMRGTKVTIEAQVMANQTIAHDRQEESLEAKARWFQSLSLAERMDMLCWFTDLMLTANPRIVEQKDAQPLAGRVRIITPDTPSGASG